MVILSEDAIKWRDSLMEDLAEAEEKLESLYEDFDFLARTARHFDESVLVPIATNIANTLCRMYDRIGDDADRIKRIRRRIDENFSD